MNGKCRAGGARGLRAFHVLIVPVISFFLSAYVHMLVCLSVGDADENDAAGLENAPKGLQCSRCVSSSYVLQT